MMKLVVISGRSGSGKTTALHVLEDLGYYCVDNLPVTLLRDLMGELAKRNSTTDVAIGIDARNSVEQLEKLPSVLREIYSDGIESQVIYLDASDENLIKRFSETRRKHPISDGNHTLNEAIERCRSRGDVERIISAETRREGNRQVHVIKYLTKDNKVRTARYDGPKD